jgi:hypothetical protein
LSVYDRAAEIQRRIRGCPAAIGETLGAEVQPTPSARTDAISTFTTDISRGNGRDANISIHRMKSTLHSNCRHGYRARTPGLGMIS